MSGNLCFGKAQGLQCADLGTLYMDHTVHTGNDGQYGDQQKYDGKDGADGLVLLHLCVHHGNAGGFCPGGVHRVVAVQRLVDLVADVCGHTVLFRSEHDLCMGHHIDEFRRVRFL